ncbi:caffeoylshikimate esterase [Panicum miliaceum]|uniref:Caffeoylshikimate esterase n=1 Tax=Panicum miliaceum TaxID=4540 RepID=A0A3L6R194_PANMI|nr:caffeoylshikimate esterase [Panicum miliaceum]
MAAISHRIAGPGPLGAAAAPHRPLGRSAAVIAAAAAKGARRARALEGASDELRAAAAQCLDWAPARRRVRAAFAPVLPTLDHCLFKMAPKGIQMEENYEKNSKGVEIFWKSWLPREGTAAKAALFFCHGYGDTCTFFFEGIAKRIAAAGYAVYAMDYPGFGLSYGLHGYIANFDGMVDHVIEQYARIRGMKEVRELPHFLLGQSMGGAVALKIHLKQEKEWDGVLLVAPMCKISEDVTPPAPVLKALSILSCLLPEAKLFPQKDIGDLAFRDPRKRKVAEYNAISYSDQMRLRTAVELLKATKDIESQLEKISSPLLILHGAADMVTDPQVHPRATPPTMSSLNSLFNRSTFGTKCKTCLNLVISRIKLLRNRRELQLINMRKEMVQYLQTGQESIARIRVEHIIREQNILAAYEIVELFCEFVLARVPIVEVQKECPLELREAIASIIFASGRCSDLPELMHLRNLFTTKYGKEFVAAAMELRPDSGVNRTIIEKLSVKAPSGESKLKVLKAIAQEYNVEWDSSNTEAEFNKKYEDLLDGSGSSVHQVQPPIIENSPVASASRDKPPALNPPVRDAEKHQFLESPSSPAGGSRAYVASKTIVATQEHHSPAEEISCTNPSSSDVLEKARAAIAAATRASAAARAAAELANVKSTSQ